METIRELIASALGWVALFAVPAVVILAAIPMVQGNFKKGIVRFGVGIAGILVLVAGSNILGFAVNTVDGELEGVKSDLPKVEVPK